MPTPTGWRTKDVIPYLEGILTALPGMQHVQRGEPYDPPANINAYILVGGQQPLRKATGGYYQRTGRFTVMFVFRVAGEEDDAEDALADMIDAFEQAILGDLSAGGLSRDVEINTAPADNPDYRRLLGQEYRLYPLEVILTQTIRISPTP